MPRIHVLAVTDCPSAMLFDTHTHLYLPEFTENNAHGGVEAVDRAVDAGVTKMIFPNVDLTTVEPMKTLHACRPDSTLMAMGFHPTEVNEGWRDSLARIREIADDWSEYVAVGEIGIDLYWDKTYEEQQMQALECQMQWATDRDLPVIIHCREGLPQTLEVLQAFPNASGVMHSFGGTPKDVEDVRKVVDFYFGINGIVTFKNSKLRNSLSAIGSGRLLLETDSPYLAPVPHRGKRNESAFITHTAHYVAECMGLDYDTVGKVTSENAGALFRIDRS